VTVKQAIELKNKTYVLCNNRILLFTGYNHSVNMCYLVSLDGKAEMYDHPSEVELLSGPVQELF
jgi:hypothetical protein